MAVSVQVVDGGHCLVGDWPGTGVGNEFLAHLRTRAFSPATVRAYAFDLANPRAAATVRTVLQAVRAFDARYGFRKLAGHLAGSDAAGVGDGPLAHGPTRGALRALGVKGAERWLQVCQDAGFLRLVPRRLAGGQRTVHLVAVGPRGIRVLKGEPPGTAGG